MSFLRKWASEATEERSAREDRQPVVPTVLPSTKRQGNVDGSSHPSPDNAVRLIEDRRAKALELLGELLHLYNERAAILEFDAGFPKAEAERLAMIETTATGVYRRWLALR